MSESKKNRPAIFRALGNAEPPETVSIGGVKFSRLKVFKHDSWAATALYETGSQKIVAKFNRQQSLFGFPLCWLGRWLAKREGAHFERLADIRNVPRLCPPVFAEGGIQRMKHAVAHDYVEGKPLGKNDPVPESFDEQLRNLFVEIHQRKLAYVDLHKRENIIVGTDGSPYLIDFQVSLMAPEKSGWLSTMRHWMVGLLQRMDQYHLDMHRAHHEYLRGQPKPATSRPWWIKAHRCITIPIRQSRRWLLVKLGIRQGAGQAHTEYFPEEAFR